MRRLWLTLMLALSLVASGFAGAAMAANCPMQAEAQHDCCPDDGAPDAPAQGQMDGCVMGVACRSALSLAPSLNPVRLLATPIRLTEPVLGEPAPPSGPLVEFWRPPRTL